MFTCLYNVGLDVPNVKHCSLKFIVAANTVNNNTSHINRESMLRNYMYTLEGVLMCVCFAVTDTKLEAEMQRGINEAY